MLLIVDQSLAVGFIPINTRKQRASLPFKPIGSVHERKVYNNDDITFISVYKRLPSPSVIMCCSPHRFTVWAATHYHTWAWQTFIQGKQCFMLLVKYILYAKKPVKRHV